MICYTVTYTKANLILLCLIYRDRIPLLIFNTEKKHMIYLMHINIRICYPIKTKPGFRTTNPIRRDPQSWQVRCELSQRCERIRVMWEMKNRGARNYRMYAWTKGENNDSPLHSGHAAQSTHAHFCTQVLSNFWAQKSSHMCVVVWPKGVVDLVCTL